MKSKIVQRTNYSYEKSIWVKFWFIQLQICSVSCYISCWNYTKCVRGPTYRSTQHDVSLLWCDRKWRYSVQLYWGTRNEEFQSRKHTECCKCHGQITGNDFWHGFWCRTRLVLSGSQLDLLLPHLEQKYWFIKPYRILIMIIHISDSWTKKTTILLSK